MINVASLETENVIVASHLGKDVELIKLATELPKTFDFMASFLETFVTICIKPF